MAELTGLQAVVDEQRKALPDADEQRQAALFEEQLALPGPLSEPCDRQQMPARPKIGRPQGSRNRSTEDIRRLVLSTHRDPLMVLADFWSQPVEEIARRLGCDLLDAARLQIEAMRTGLPYLHKRQPQDIAVQGALPVLNLIVGGQAGPAIDGEAIEVLPIAGGNADEA